MLLLKLRWAAVLLKEFWRCRRAESASCLPAIPGRAGGLGRMRGPGKLCLVSPDMSGFGCSDANLDDGLDALLWVLKCSSSPLHSTRLGPPWACIPGWAAARAWVSLCGSGPGGDVLWNRYWIFIKLDSVLFSLPALTRWAFAQRLLLFEGDLLGRLGIHRARVVFASTTHPLIQVRRLVGLHRNTLQSVLVHRKRASTSIYSRRWI